MSTRILVWRNAAVAGCLVLLVLLGTWVVILNAPVPDDPSPGLVTPSRRTTYITEPLRADGSVDYLAAINQRCSKGVTPDNNASVLIWQALGPGPQAKATRSAFFKAIGMPVPTENGDYFISTAQFARQEHDGEGGGDVSIEKQARQAEEIDDQLDSATTRAWSEDELPQIAAWLRANQRPLALIIEATGRSRRFDPLVAFHDVPGQLLLVDLTMATESRAIARALVARAMLQPKRGQIDEAWQDLLAAHRLAHLVAQGDMFIEWLVGNTIKRQAFAAQRAILQNSEPSPKQIESMREDLGKLPQFPGVVDKLNIGDRFTSLDSLYSVAREMSGRTTFGTQTDPILQKVLKLFGRYRVDWELVFARINSWWDREIAACRLPVRAARKEALDELDREFEERTRHANDLKESVTTAFDSSRAVSERMADVLIALFAPAALAACDVEVRGKTELDLTKVAFALAHFRVEYGAYPDKLELLVPKYITSVPEDAFAGAPLHYQLNDGGYLLLSVGPDGQRDEIPEGGTKDAEDLGDDLIVRMRAVVPPSVQH
mgnify:CR=1 FL=1